MLFRSNNVRRSTSRLTIVFIHINYLVRNQLKFAFFHDEFILLPKLLNSREEK